MAARPAKGPKLEDDSISLGSSCDEDDHRIAL